MGSNRVFAHGGRDYHLQIEDLGDAHVAFEARVYDQGALLWRRRVPYDEIVARGLPKAEQDEALAALMEKTLITVEAAIAKGRLG